MNPTPPVPPDSLAWERLAAHASHVILYILTFGLSLTGWLMAGVGRRPLEAMLFGFVRVPLAFYKKNDILRRMGWASR